jgi:hypothetical protein
MKCLDCFNLHCQPAFFGNKAWCSVFNEPKGPTYAALISVNDNSLSRERKCDEFIGEEEN